MYLNIFLHWNSWILPPLGILLNFILLWIILHRTPSEILFHCRIFLFNCMFGILFYMFSLIGIPIWSITTIDGNGIIFVSGYLTSTSFFSTFLNADPMSIWTLFLYWHFFFLLNILAIAGQFISRYLILIHNMNLKFGHYFLFTFIIFLISYFTCFNTNLIVLNALPKDNASGKSSLLIDFEQNPIYAIFSLDPKELIFGSARYRNMSIQTKTHDSMLAMYTWICNNILLIYCGHEVYEFVARERMKMLHKELNKTMLLCTGCQLLFQGMFIFLYLTSLLFPLDNFALFWSATICWLPLINSLTCLLAFPPYRETLIGPIKKMIGRIFIQ